MTCTDGYVILVRRRQDKDSFWPNFLDVKIGGLLACAKFFLSIRTFLRTFCSLYLQTCISLLRSCLTSMHRKDVKVGTPPSYYKYYPLIAINSPHLISRENPLSFKNLAVFSSIYIPPSPATGKCDIPRTERRCNCVRKRNTKIEQTQGLKRCLISNC